MPVPKLPVVRTAENDEKLVQNLYDAYCKLRKELEFLMSNLDEDNVLKARAVIADWIYAGNISADQITTGTLDADKVNVINLDAQTIVSYNLITQNLTAERGNIAELTVDRLDTSKKVANYKATPKKIDDVNYIKVEDETIEFITASTDGTSTAFVYDRNDQKLYWTDGTMTAVTTDVTAYPILTFAYTEYTKLKIYFKQVGESILPMIELGTGFGNETYPDRGKFFVYKETDGGLLKYVATDGTEYSIKLGEDGISINGVDLDKIDFYTDGFEAVYGGSSEKYKWTKDIEGKITQLEDFVTGKIVPITWGTGSIVPPPLNQQWSGYPQSPVLTTDFPYQCIAFNDGLNPDRDALYVSKSPIWFNSTIWQINLTKYIMYSYTNNQWVIVEDNSNIDYVDSTRCTPNFREANTDIYTNSTLTTVYFAKTTP